MPNSRVLSAGLGRQVETERNTLLAMREAATAEVIGQRTYVRVDQPGMIHFSYDGLEDQLCNPEYSLGRLANRSGRHLDLLHDGSLASTENRCFASLTISVFTFLFSFRMLLSCGKGRGYGCGGQALTHRESKRVYGASTTAWKEPQYGLTLNRSKPTGYMAAI